MSSQNSVLGIECEDKWFCDIIVAIFVSLLLSYILVLLYLIRKLKHTRAKLEIVKLEKTELVEENNQLKSESGVWNG